MGIFLQKVRARHLGANVGGWFHTGQRATGRSTSEPNGSDKSWRQGTTYFRTIWRPFLADVGTGPGSQLGAETQRHV